jgi:hypothetical protein
MPGSLLQPGADVYIIWQRYRVAVVLLCYSIHVHKAANPHYLLLLLLVPARMSLCRQFFRRAVFPEMFRTSHLRIDEK